MGHLSWLDVRPNRSVPAATVIPVLIYPDVREAVDWLSTAFGFVERVRIGEDHRSQLSFGEGAVIIGDVRGDRRPPRAGEATHSVMVRVEDAHAHCEHAREHGARILEEPKDFPYGERPRIRRATSGRSRRRSPTSRPRSGAGPPFALSGPPGSVSQPDKSSRSTNFDSRLAAFSVVEVVALVEVLDQPGLGRLAPAIEGATAPLDCEPD